MPSGRVFSQVFVAFLLGTATLAALLATEDGYGYALDEATYRWVAQESREWSAKLGEPSLGKSLNPLRIEQKCHFLEPPGSKPGQPHSNFNLPASIHVLNTGWLLGGWRSDELSRLRFGSELLFALTIGGLVWKLSGREGLIPAVGAGLGVVLCPRVFGHAHLAATETTLVCFWIWAVVAVASVVENRGSITAAAVAVGLLAATKLTAWPACAMMVVWAVARRRDRRIALAFWLIAGSAAVVYSLTPNLWHDPINGLKWYLKQAAENPWKIPAHFGGRTYTEGMPWWSGLAVLFATTPIAVLLLSAASLPRIRTDRLTELLWLNVVLLMSMRVGGLVPSHDGERQFLPAMAMLGILAGLEGGRWIQSALHRTAEHPPRPFMALLVAFVCFAGPATESWIHRRHGLCFFNRAVGGLSGAEKLGFEVSYWVETMTDAEWKRMLEPLPLGSTVFLRPDHPGWPELVRWGVIPEHVTLADKPQDADYFLLYAKKAAYWVPSADGKTMVSTDLAKMQASGPAIRELRLHGVRLASLHRRP